MAKKAGKAWEYSSREWTRGGSTWGRADIQILDILNLKTSFFTGQDK